MYPFGCRSILPSGLSLGLLSGIALFFPLKALGVEQTVPATPQTIPVTQQSDSFDSMDSSRNYLSGKITGFASYIDRFFGGDRHYQESNQSVVQMDFTRTTGYGGDDKFNLSTRLNLRLPITEGQLRLLLETDPEQNLTTEPAKGQAGINKKIIAPSSNVATPKSVAAALRFEKKDESRWYGSTDVGIQFHGITTDPNPFARARGSYSLPLGQWRLKAAETLFLFHTIGAGETTQLDLERLLSEPLLFRSTTSATWLFDTENYYLRQDLSIYHTLSDRTALLYQVSAIGVTNPHYQVTDYVALLHYRYRLHREWLFFELSPQLHFPAEKNYQSSPALGMRLEVLFDDSR